MDVPELHDMAAYYFRGSESGKALRPMIALLMARLCNKLAMPDVGIDDERGELLRANQLRIAMLAEMIHTASLIHDDVIDSSDRRRGRAALHIDVGEKKVF